MTNNTTFFKEKAKLRTWNEIEKSVIINALDWCDNNALQAALTLGIGRSTLYRKMYNYGIPLPGPKGSKNGSKGRPPYVR